MTIREFLQVYRRSDDEQREFVKINGEYFPIDEEKGIIREEYESFRGIPNDQILDMEIAEINIQIAGEVTEYRDISNIIPRIYTK